ncbi:LytS/YhcK type 5TM receptor domain-containing protein [Bacillus sp. B15-48]|uniref:LytS/YhcK type 5TM receptor domain-containing protein n=1 Tax=Bacillus sp. B15-48 TaxID=1548601 RepID=UPI00193F7B54|nr:LytS/YhcK type 5TM receptor domain-containing protein [Bacillus sp. B15-48]MBM4763615.1 sensor histidine kinase [Bacillus sp. B15-48]
MESLTITLFERLGLLLIIAFVMTRTPGFNSLLYRKYSVKMSIVHAGVFGLFGIASSVIGIVMTEDGMNRHALILFPVEDNQLIVSLSLVAIVIAGLLGGPILGFGAGVITGIHLFFLGGVGAIANALINPMTGLLAGLTARFFSNERVISPLKALFIGVFPPILHMQLLLIMNTDTVDMIATVDTIGLPLVLSNSAAIAIFTAMIGIVLREQENEAALASKQALTIAKEALPFLKKDSHFDVANGLADLLYSRLRLAAISVTDQQQVLAHRGLAEEHHVCYAPMTIPPAQRAIQFKKMQVTDSKTELISTHRKCPFEAAIFIPIIKDEQVLFLITFYFRKREHVSPVERMMAQGLGQFISDQLNMLEAEKLKAHIRDAELRNLQAQINPHFLFNTLQLIAGLFRENPANARHLTLQLASYMRFNLRLVSKSLVEFEKECEHVEAYTAIIQERFRGRIKIILRKPEDISNIYIPPSTIQPLIENSVHHGLKNVTGDAKVEIFIEKQEGKLTVFVRDNGKGFPNELLPIAGKQPLGGEEKGGTGIYNVNQRLVQLLGESARLVIRNLPSGGSEVKFSIPTPNEYKEKQVIG